VLFLTSSYLSSKLSRNQYTHHHYQLTQICSIVKVLFEVEGGMCVTVSFPPPAVVIIGFTIDKKKRWARHVFWWSFFFFPPAILVTISALLGSRSYDIITALEEREK
jgi:hypothetical protein